MGRRFCKVTWYTSMIHQFKEASKKLTAISRILHYLSQNERKVIIWSEMFVRLLTVHFHQNDSYEIAVNGFQVRKINEIIIVIFGLRYGKPSSALRLKLGCSPSWVLDKIWIFWGELCLNNKDSLSNLIQGKCRINLKIPFSDYEIAQIW